MVRTRRGARGCQQFSAVRRALDSTYVRMTVTCSSRSWAGAWPAMPAPPAILDDYGPCWRAGDESQGLFSGTKMANCQRRMSTGRYCFDGLEHRSGDRLAFGVPRHNAPDERRPRWTPRRRRRGAQAACCPPTTTLRGAAQRNAFRGSGARPVAADRVCGRLNEGVTRGWNANTCTIPARPARPAGAGAGPATSCSCALAIPPSKLGRHTGGFTSYFIIFAPAADADLGATARRTCSQPAGAARLAAGIPGYTVA